MIAERAPVPLVLGIAATLAAALVVPRPTPPSRPPPLRAEPTPEPIEIHTQFDCDLHAVSTIVISGSLRSHYSIDNHFSIAFPGRRHTYGAVTDARGYFEVRIPREDFVDALCELPATTGFDDQEMTLRYHYDFER